MRLIRGSFRCRAPARLRDTVLSILAVGMMFGPALAVAAAAGAVEPGLWSQVMAFVAEQQREFHRDLVGAVRALRSDAGIAAAWTLVVVSFLYGVFHAAGPGHGKVVITTYLLTQEDRIRRGVVIAAAAALVQGLTAIVLVEGAVSLFNLGRREAFEGVGALETVSFGLIALLGAGLTVRAVLRLWRLRRFGGASAAFGTENVSPPLSRGQAVSDGASHVASHRAGEHAGHGDCCGHAHLPSAEQVSRAASWRGAAAVVLSIGIRPCSGAVIVLLVAQVMGLQVAGYLAVLVMSAGTALAVCLLAFLTVGMRRVALRFVDAENRTFALAGHAIGAAGGLAIAAVGGSLFLGSLGPAHPLM